MALEATHMRFALDILERYQVNSLQDYLSGTIYPDSRYVTGVDRNLTHNTNILDQRFAKDDFTSGWQAHCICDEVQRAAHKELFPELHEYKGSQKWITLTSLKILQDMNDARQTDLQKYLPCLDYVHNPNNEDIDSIRDYNKTIQDLYSERYVVPKYYYKMCIKFGFDQNLTHSLINTLEEFMTTLPWEKQMIQSYKMMMNLYKGY